MAGAGGPGRVWAELRVESPVRQGLEFKVRKLQASRFPRQRPKNRLSKRIQAAGMACGHSYMNQMEFPLRWPRWSGQGSRCLRAGPVVSVSRAGRKEVPSDAGCPQGLLPAWALGLDLPLGPCPQAYSLALATS